MIELLKKMLGLGKKTDFSTLIAQGATIIDVRSSTEFKGGHLKNSTNIPLEQLEKRLSEIAKDKPVITCCASGIRSAVAKNTLQKHGFLAVYNGGSWASLQKFER